MKILLIFFQPVQFPETVYPVGLDMVRDLLVQAGHYVIQVTLTSLAREKDSLTRQVHFFEPELIGLSIRNVDDIDMVTSTTFLAHYQDLMHSLRALTDAPVVLGGAGFSLFPEPYLKALNAEYGFVGEVDEGFLAFISTLECHQPVAPLTYSSRTGRQAYMPDPAFLKSLRDNGQPAPLSTRRGCPFACLYCNYPALEGRQVRTQAIPQLLLQLHAIAEAGLSEVVFVDSVFNEPAAFTCELCEQILESGIRVNWSAFVSPRGITPQQLRLYRQAGCVGLEWGVDSFAPAMIAALAKPFSHAQAVDAIRSAQAIGIMNQVYLILGGPGENVQTLEESFEVIASLRPELVVVIPGLRIYPGTALYERALEEGVITPQDDLLVEKRFYFSDQLTLDGLKSYLLQKSALFPNLAVPAFGVEPYVQLSARRPAGLSKWDLLRRAIH